ncbi:hypothetical protein Bxe_A2247 [Paraburkholderia xenovorans LB400]|uniref:Transmembrane protein n=1 Tax=Paraburkholderia xenovorans (strain LB400) TaxID=266265 RepID=Q13YW7_PARXL|nr:hypothetical protein Bxe_A2247 [Paraburkholderia xenovorans LB400]
MFGIFYRFRCFFISQNAFPQADPASSDRFPTKLTPQSPRSFCDPDGDKKIARDFFRVIFLFKKLARHFFFMKWIILLIALYSFHLTRFY